MAENMQALSKRWQRHDWQTSPYAPRLRVVQALVDGGATASGAGFSRHDAYMRCLGETAEIIALQSEALPAFGSEGLAAGPDVAFASYAALCERLERWAIKAWWVGEVSAHPLTGAESQIEQLREGAFIPRNTRLWQVPFGPLDVVISASSNAENGQPVLGFGADICAEKAARSAILEMGLMELNLAESSPRMQSYFNRISAITLTRFSDSKPRKIKALSLTEPQKLEALKARLESADIGYAFQDLSSAQTALSVVRAIMHGAPGFSQPDDKANSPLL